MISGAIGYNICIGTLESRRDEGMSWEECVKTPLARIRRITINGEVRRVKDWCEFYGSHRISINIDALLRMRLNIMVSMW